MKTYYSNKTDLSNTTAASDYTLTVSEQVKTMLGNLTAVATTLKEEGETALYSNGGTALLSDYDSYSGSTFEASYLRSTGLLTLGNRIHPEIVQNIDNKFVKGLDDAFASLNNVNGAKNSYKTTSIKEVTGGGSGPSGTAQGHVHYYTLAEILGKNSPIQAARDYYQERLDALHLALGQEADQSGAQITMDPEQRAKLEGMTDDELMATVYPNLTTDYQQLRENGWQEENKELLGYLDFGVGVAFAGIALLGGIPGVIAATAYAAGKAAYSVATGHDAVTGEAQTGREQAWSVAQAAAGALPIGAAGLVRVGKAGPGLVNGAGTVADAVEYAAIADEFVRGDPNKAARDATVSLSLKTIAARRGGSSSGSTGDAPPAEAPTVDAPDTSPGPDLSLDGDVDSPTAGGADTGSAPDTSLGRGADIPSVDNPLDAPPPFDQRAWTAEARQNYSVNHLHLANNKVVPSYDPATGDIVARKKDLSGFDTTEELGAYLEEFKGRYPVGTVIHSNKYPHLNGQTLEGQYVLEVPADVNGGFAKLEEYQQFAAEQGVEIRLR